MVMTTLVVTQLLILLLLTIGLVAEGTVTAKDNDPIDVLLRAVRRRGHHMLQTVDDASCPSTIEGGGGGIVDSLRSLCNKASPKFDEKTIQSAIERFLTVDEDRHSGDFVDPFSPFQGDIMMAPSSSSSTQGNAEEGVKLEKEAKQPASRDDLFSCLHQLKKGDAAIFAAVEWMSSLRHRTISPPTADSQKQCADGTAAAAKDDDDTLLVAAPSGWRYLGPFTMGKTELDSNPFPSTTSSLLVDRNSKTDANQQEGDITATTMGASPFVTEAMRYSRFSQLSSHLPKKTRQKVIANHFRYTSESVSPRGAVEWTTLPGTAVSSKSKRRLRDGQYYPAAATTLNIAHQDLQSLIQEMGTTAAVEFVGFAFSEYLVLQPDVTIHVEAAGVHSIFVTSRPLEGVAAAGGEDDDEPTSSRHRRPRPIETLPVSGDQYHRHGTSSFLVRRPSLVRLHIRVRGAMQSQIRIRLKATSTASATGGSSRRKGSSVAVKASLRPPLYTPDFTFDDASGFGFLAPRTSMPPADGGTTTTGSTASTVQGGEGMAAGWVAPVLQLLEGGGADNIAMVVTKVVAVTAANSPRSLKGLQFCTNIECGTELGRSDGDDEKEDVLLQRYTSTLRDAMMISGGKETTIMAVPGQLLPLPTRLGFKTAQDVQAVAAFCRTKKDATFDVKLQVHLKFLANNQSGNSNGAKEQQLEAVTTVDTTMPVRCRHLRRHTISMTYLAYDHSVAVAVVKPPPAPQKKSQKEEVHQKLYRSVPVVLALHGTGVTAQSQADSYKRLATKEETSHGVNDGEYVFGVERAWLVAADRHGAHNWETVGRLSAMSALLYAHLAVATSTRDIKEEEVGTTTHNTLRSFGGLPMIDVNRILFAGHSMGGHGAVHLATTYPRRAIGCVFVASWLNKETYGDANLAFRPLDRAGSHVDGKLRGILESTVSDSTPDLLVANLLHVPVYIRVGAKDRTVSPFFSRRLLRLLQDRGHRDVTYDEVPNQEHWWWDTVKPNDGGCVNDDKLRAFFSRAIHAAATSRRTTDGVVLPPDDRQPLQSKQQQQLTVTDLYFSGDRPCLEVKAQQQQPSHVGEVDDSGGSGSGRHHLLCIQRQRFPHQRSTLTATSSSSSDMLHVNTVNIAELRLEFSLPPSSTSSSEGRGRSSNITIRIDGRRVPLTVADCQKKMKDVVIVIIMTFQLGEWRVSTPTAAAVAVPSSVSLGSMRRYTEVGPIHVAVPSSCTSVTAEAPSTARYCHRYLSFATYFANLHWIAYETTVRLIFVNTTNPIEKKANDDDVSPSSTALRGGGGSKVSFRWIGEEMESPHLHGDGGGGGVQSSIRIHPKVPIKVTCYTNDDDVDGDQEEEDHQAHLLSEGCPSGSYRVVIDGTVVATGSDLAIATLAPPPVLLDSEKENTAADGGGGGGGIELILAATSTVGMEHLLYDIGQPTVPPMMRSPFSNMLPSLVVTDASKAHEGIGAVVFAAYLTADGTVVEDSMFSRN